MIAFKKQMVEQDQKLPETLPIYPFKLVKTLKMTSKKLQKATEQSFFLTLVYFPLQGNVLTLLIYNVLQWLAFSIEIL